MRTKCPGKLGMVRPQLSLSRHAEADGTMASAVPAPCSRHHATSTCGLSPATRMRYSSYEPRVATLKCSLA